MDFFKYAIVDIGANSVRMIIYDIDPKTGEFFTVDSVRNMMGLAAYKEAGALTPDGAGKLTAIIRDYLARANSYPCDKFSAFATASLRGLSNSAQFIASIKRKFGVDIDIISGEDEAAYDFDAIRYRFGREVFPRGVVIDMGGGSTEMIEFENERATSLVSMNLGCVMLGKKFISDIKRSPFPNEAESEDIINYTKKTLSQNESFREKGESIYLIGGTGRAIAKLHAVMNGVNVKNFDGYTFSAHDIKSIRDFAEKDVREGAPIIRKLLSDRITTILPGIIAYEQIFAFLGSKLATVSACGVREGYLLRFINQSFSQKSQEF